MTALPDPHELYAVADRIAAHARSTHERADLLQRRLDHETWRGPAAVAFGSSAAAIVHGLRTCAARLGDAADALRRHAREVQARLDVLTHLRGVLLAFGVDVTHLLADGLVTPLDLLEHAGALLDGVRGLAGDADGVIEHAGGVVERVLGLG